MVSVVPGLCNVVLEEDENNYNDDFKASRFKSSSGDQDPTQLKVQNHPKEPSKVPLLTDVDWDVEIKCVTEIRKAETSGITFEI